MTCLFLVQPTPLGEEVPLKSCLFCSYLIRLISLLLDSKPVGNGSAKTLPGCLYYYIFYTLLRYSNS